jgi:UDP-N-acetylglucosamine:LPS N-acetylglucosamine transferase
VSGPEPQRSLFEAELARRFIESDEASLLLRGKPNERDIKDIAKLKIVPHLEDDAFLAALSHSEKVICRSGYSTIMDLHVLGVKAQFHPTPGQTEQEYLASLHGEDN